MLALAAVGAELRAMLLNKPAKLCIFYATLLFRTQILCKIMRTQNSDILEIMLCEVLSEFPQPALPLARNVSVNVT